MSTNVVVVAAVVERDGTFLVTRRLQGTHLEGLWEFPGGKCDAGETHADCLAREMVEELATDVAVGPLILSVSHAYPDRTIELNFYRCELLHEPVPQIGQEMQWVSRAALRDLPMPPADAELINMLAQCNS